MFLELKLQVGLAYIQKADSWPLQMTASVISTLVLLDFKSQPI
jgi:hypothetical protein